MKPFVLVGVVAEGDAVCVLERTADRKLHERLEKGSSSTYTVPVKVP